MRADRLLSLLLIVHTWARTRASWQRGESQLTRFFDTFGSPSRAGRG